MGSDQNSVDELAMLHQKILWDQLWERQFDRILYGHDLRYAPARHLVKRSYDNGNENLLRARLCPEDSG